MMESSYIVCLIYARSSHDTFCGSLCGEVIFGGCRWVWAGFGLGYLVLCCAERKACYGGVVFEDIGVVFVLLLGV